MPRKAQCKMPEHYTTVYSNMKRSDTKPRVNSAYTVSIFSLNSASDLGYALKGPSVVYCTSVCRGSRLLLFQSTY